MASTTKVSTAKPSLPGVTYIPDKIEIEIDDPIVKKVAIEFLDFLKSLTDLMKLMYTVKTKHLRSMVPMPTPVLREIMVLDNTGPRYKAWDRSCSGAMPGISNSADNLFKMGVSSTSISHGSTARQKPVLRKQEQQKKRKGGLDNDLIEITGKKTKPLWHAVALEPVGPSFGPISGSRAKFYVQDHFGLEKLLVKKNRPVNRSNSEQLLINIKAATTAEVQPSSATFEAQMDMLLARDAGFTSVEEHKAFLDTQKPHWYKDLLMAALRSGILYNFEIVRAFEAMGKYYETTKNSIAHPKPKLCFLVMSLPVWDLCQIGLQHAISFFLQVILEVSSAANTLTEWLKVRKLSYLVQPPMTSEDMYMNVPPTYEKPTKESISVHE